MRLLCMLLVISAILIVEFHHVKSAKILGVFPTSSRSHYIVGSALMKALAKKGHEVTVISPFPQIKPIMNYHDVTTNDIWNAVEPFTTNLLNFGQKGAFGGIKEMYRFGHTVANSTMNDPAVTKFIKSNEQFDLVVLEIFMNDAMLGKLQEEYTFG